MRRVAVVAIAALLVLFARAAAADQVFFVVRHAERAASPTPPPAPPTPTKAQPHGMMIADDVPLSAAGEQRAARLAAMLAQSGIKAIFTTEFKRTRQTAAPLAEKLKIKPVMSAANDPAPLLAQLKRATAPVLVVGHGNTVPALLKALGVSETVTIGDDEYDNLFVVVRNAAGKATLVRLKY